MIRKRYTPQEAARILSALKEIPDDCSDLDNESNSVSDESDTNSEEFIPEDDLTSDSSDSDDIDEDEINPLGKNQRSSTARGRVCRGGKGGRPTSNTCPVPDPHDSAVTDAQDHGDVSEQQGIATQASGRVGATGSALLSLKIGDSIPGTDGTEWTITKEGESCGRRGAQNVVREKMGPTPYAKRYVTEGVVRSSWGLFVCESMLKHIQRCTQVYARERTGDEFWSVSLEELNAFFAIMYARGAYGARHLDHKILWSKVWGPAFFSKTMSRDRFKEISSCLRFDLKSERSQRLGGDKFALASEVWDKFIQNCQACYTPGPYLTVDEQLFPSKTRCKFIQYMPQKPDKFGIKFWMLADSESKYMCTAAPYLGKNAERPQGETLAEHVVMNLARPYLKKGRNITTDNYFTSMNLAKKLKANNTSIVGTKNRARREVPKIVKESKAPLHTTTILKDGDTTLTVYQGKVSKNVIVLSTMHESVMSSDVGKKLPETVEFYNKTKSGVDTVDQMSRKYSTRTSTRRWPVHVFQNILDLAGINAWIVYNECTKIKISRHKFLLQLANEMSRAYICNREKKPDDDGLSLEPGPSGIQKRRKCLIRKECKGNKSTHVCVSCEKPVCGKCTKVSKAYCQICNGNE